MKKETKEGTTQTGHTFVTRRRVYRDMTRKTKVVLLINVEPSILRWSCSVF